jgi:septal ring factor EnvC (AmiA/AmiB activator)
MIQDIIIASAPAITAILGIVVAVTEVRKNIKSVNGELSELKNINKCIMKENAELKKELKEVYKLHSEIVQHIRYKEKNNEQKNKEL